MNSLSDVIERLSGKTDNLVDLYAQEADRQRERYLHIAQSFQAEFPGNEDVFFFSTPGRTEIGGNHTDHNGGRILAGSVNLDVIAIVSPNDKNCIKLISEGYGTIEVDLSGLEPAEEEKNTSVSLIRGVCARISELGYKIGGFNAYAMSDIKDGAGLSSSAAFEVQIATIINHLYNEGEIGPVEIAKIAQYAENHYYGKPCGLMDMTVCSVGGLVEIDFKDFDNPIVRKINYDFSRCGCDLVIVYVGEGHEGLSDEYTALENEMKEVAKALGGSVLREFSKELVIENMAVLRRKLSDRAILRALHFYSDDERVTQQSDFLDAGQLRLFLQSIIDSGYSSWMLCQNVYVWCDVKKQGLSIALAVSKQILEGKGAWRIHGGGFGGTIQAFVPKSLTKSYINDMDAIFGEGAGVKLAIRNEGSVLVNV